MLRTALLGVLLLYSHGFVPPAHLDFGSDIDESKYIKEVHHVRMRDGTKLNTVVFIPTHDITKKKATVMMRTPYGAQGLAGEGKTFVDLDFVAVMQDFRGRYGSDGKFECWRDAATDGHDTIAWITKQRWSNTVVFQSGVSANGIATYLDDLSETTQLHAQWITVATAQLHRTLFQNGAYRQSLIHRWLAGIKESSFEINFKEHEGPGPWWTPLNMTGQWNKVLQPAVHVTGWYDIFNQQTLDAYTGYSTGATVGKSLNWIVVLPTGHCAGGAVKWPNWGDGIATATALVATLFKALADSTSPQKYLEDITALEALNKGKDTHFWYVMGPGLSGTKGNYWTKGTKFPDYTSTPLYLGSGGVLSESKTGTGNTSFVYNPADPVPTVGGNNLLLHKCGPWDQSALEKRSDVITFTSPVLTTEYALTGKMWVYLYVSSTANDTDFTVKLTDVFPNGTSLLIQDSIIRMRWRDPYSPKPQFLTPGQVYPVAIDLWSTSYIYNTGHKVRLDVSSSNYPRFSANPNNGLPITENGTLVTATNTVHFGPNYPSRLVLPIVPLSALPQVQL